MRRIENETVAAIERGDVEEAQALLLRLLTLDRRRAWWALFRAAAAIQADDRRAAMLALVSRTYIARRSGRMVGVPDEPVVGALVGWLMLTDWDRSGDDLTDAERAQLAQWLPARISRLLDGTNQHSWARRKGDHG